MERQVMKEELLHTITQRNQEDVDQEGILLLESYITKARDIKDIFALCSEVYDEIYYDVVIKHRPINTVFWNLLETFSLPTLQKTKQELYRIFQSEIEEVKKKNKKKWLVTGETKNREKCVV